jgi:glycosyltransferase involved in cell wall biosynthesis
MKISVIVPTYNRAALLPATLDAVLSQTRPADEVIVVDDGSEDDTGRVLRAYEGRIRVLKIVNSGELAARNIGVRVATGDLLAFCDSDDLWHPDFLARMSLLWHLEPRTTVGYSDFVTLQNGVRSTISKFAAAPCDFWFDFRLLGDDAGVFDEPIVPKVVGFQPFFPSCMVVSSALFRSVGGWDEGVARTVGHDFATLLKMAEHPPFGVVRMPLVDIRKHAGNYSHDVQKMELGDSKVLEYVLATRPSLRSHGKTLRSSIAKRRQAALETAFVRGDFAAVRDIFHVLPSNKRPARLRAKYVVAKLPAAFRASAWKALSLAGSLRSARNRRVGRSPAVSAEPPEKSPS